jgi:hypothetical protein
VGNDYAHRTFVSFKARAQFSLTYSIVASIHLHEPIFGDSERLVLFGGFTEVSFPDPVLYVGCAPRIGARAGAHSLSTVEKA